ncbi:MAG: hypothetical protein MUF49_06855 [Oculatellaceae cyanobacterium Prado106]|nr:hypothetical protein [Oculatellaceae cyanobacterium Prado106]
MFQRRIFDEGKTKRSHCLLHPYTHKPAIGSALGFPPPKSPNFGGL